MLDKKYGGGTHLKAAGQEKKRKMFSFLEVSVFTAPVNHQDRGKYYP
jgi:hypothetical protein